MALSRENISQRKLEGYLQWAKIVQWGRRNPVAFCEKFFGIEFMDYQRYVFMNSWSKPFVLWVMSRNAGKSTLSAPFAMAKMLLFNNFESYILSVTSAQSQDTFLKIEKIAKQQIESFTGLTDIFFNEIVKSTSNTDGFTHSPQGFKFKLFNGSGITSLSGMEDNLRGKRSNLNIYDESGFITENYIATTSAFTTQNSSFKLGGDIDTETLPKQMPNQLLFCSSASSIDTYFFSKYKEYSKMMLLGSKQHFVADINCDMVINATNHGKKLFVPLLTQEKVDDAMRQNREKALREYYNIFTTEGGANQPIKRAEIIKNSELRVPTLCNDNNAKRRFVFAYDPARSYDNSIVTIGEIIHDTDVGYKLKIINCVSLVDIGKKKRTPMRTPEQIDYIKQLILDYNGKEFADYENIDKILIDSGAGGGGVNIADYFMEDWTSKDNKPHKGMIDKENSADYIGKFPNALDKISLVSPQKYRTEMFDSLIEMLNLGLISFTENYDMKGYIMLPENSNDNINYKQKNLSFEEELALKNIDLAKEEMVLIYRFEGSNGAYRYDLPADKKRNTHDDRAYTMAMLGWYLQNIRRNDKLKGANQSEYDFDFFYN